MADGDADAAAVLDAFKQFDVANEGYITQEELEDVIGKLAPPGGTGVVWTRKNIKILMEKIDSNHDGKIQYKEFVAWVFGTDCQCQGQSPKAGKKEAQSPKNGKKEGQSPKNGKKEGRIQSKEGKTPGKKGQSPSSAAKPGKANDEKRSKDEKRGKDDKQGKDKTPQQSKEKPGGKKVETPSGKVKKPPVPAEEEEAEEEEDDEDEGEEDDDGEGSEEEGDEEDGSESEAEEDEDEAEDEAENDSEDEPEEEEEEEEEEPSEDSDSQGEEICAFRIVSAARNLVWQKLMPAEEGTARAVADSMKEMPPPDKKKPEDAQHAELYVRNHTDDRELDGQAPPGATRKQALRWLYAALDRISEGDHRYQQPTKYLLGNWRLWPENQDGEEKEFVKLKNFAAKKLDVIGVDFERDVFEAKGIGKALGDVGKSIPPARPRQDEGLPMPPDFKPKLIAPEPSPEDFAEAIDHFYMALLLTAVHAIDPLFQEQARSVCEAAGGDCKGPAPKGFMRMFAKLTTDHSTADRPRPAENIDTNRVAWTFEEPEQLRKAFNGAVKAWGQPLRVKNGYNPEFKALEITKGYRNILANYRYEPEGLTWGKLINGKDSPVKGIWTRLRDKMLKSFLKYGYADESALDDEWRQYLSYFDAAREHLSSKAMRDTPVVLIVEVQYMLRSYMTMRKKTHAWYKIVRADNAEAMVWDYMWNS